MATGRKVTPKPKVVPKSKPKISSKPKANQSRDPEAAVKPAPVGSPTNPCGMGDPNRDRVAEFLALSTREMVFDQLLHPEEWLDWPNPQFDGRKPNDLLGTDKEVCLRDILIAHALGMF